MSKMVEGIKQKNENKTHLSKYVTLVRKAFKKIRPSPHFWYFLGSWKEAPLKKQSSYMPSVTNMAFLNTCYYQLLEKKSSKNRV